MAKASQIEWDAQRSPVANASRFLPGLAATYFAEARKVLAEANEHADLHRLRLLSKRLRYTLELFRSCYGPGLDERIRALRRIQDLLGEINDAVASARLIRKARGAVRMRQYLERRAAQKAAEFRMEWQTRFDAPGQEAWWMGYLHRAGRIAAKAPVGNRGAGRVSTGSGRHNGGRRKPYSGGPSGAAADGARSGEPARLGAPFDPRKPETAASDPS
jgi:hypothetical protein